MDDAARHRALLSALDLAAAPRLARLARRQPLPDGVLEVIRIAAGCEETLRAAAQFSGRDPAFIKAAAELYAQRILLFSSADSHRVLGVRAGAGRDEMRLHMRWLMTWLHPDHRGASWQAAYAARVIEAWGELGRATPPPLEGAGFADTPQQAAHHEISWPRRLASPRPARPRRFASGGPESVSARLLLSLVIALLMTALVVMSSDRGAGGELPARAAGDDGAKSTTSRDSCCGGLL